MISPTALETRLRQCEAGLAEIRYRAGVIERELGILREAGAHSAEPEERPEPTWPCARAGSDAGRCTTNCARLLSGGKHCSDDPPEPSLFERTEATS